MTPPLSDLAAAAPAAATPGASTSPGPGRGARHRGAGPVDGAPAWVRAFDDLDLLVRGLADAR